MTRSGRAHGSETTPAFLKGRVAIVWAEGIGSHAAMMRVDMKQYDLM